MNMAEMVAIIQALLIVPLTLMTAILVHLIKAVHDIQRRVTRIEAKQ